MSKCIFLWENTFMNSWFFLDSFLKYGCMQKKILFENANINGVFENAYTMYEILENA